MSCFRSAEEEGASVEEPDGREAEEEGLNNRLFLFRSIVPKITKMDRALILGDTIDYMKELLGRIHLLEQGNNEWTLNNCFKLSKEAKPNEVLVWNLPEFHVERRNEDTTIEISCIGKPELLLRTMSTLEALGLEVEQCVVSCFNDFAMRASCSEVRREVLVKF